MPRTLGKANYLAGRAAAPVVGAVTRLAPAALGGAVASQLGDYQIDDPSVDSSAAGTFRSLRDGDFAGAGRSLSKGALEAGMDLGGSVAKGIDLLTFGKAGAEQGYNDLLRSQFGDQLRIGGAPATPAAKPALRPTTPTAPALPANFRGNGFNDPRSTTFDNTGPSRDFTNELASVPRELPSDLRNGVIFKTKDANGRTVYSGRDVGAGAQFVDGKGATLRGGGTGTVSTVPGMSKEQIAEIMARPSAFNPNSGLSAAQQVQYQREVENAQRINAFSAAQSRASSLRQPSQNQLDPSRLPGESRSAYATRVNAMVGMRGQDFGEIQDVRRDGTARRGQDLNYDSTLRGQDVNARVAAQDREAQAQIAAARARQDQFNKDREFGLNLTKEQRAAREAAQTSLDKQLDTFSTTMVDGKPVIDPAKRALFADAVNSMQGRAIEAALAAGNQRLAAKIQAEGVAGLDQSALRQMLRTAEIQAAAKADDGKWLPWKGSYVDSDNPEDFKPAIDPKTGKPKIEKGLIWDKAELRGGSRVNPEALSKFGDSPTRRYDNLR